MAPSGYEKVKIAPVKHLESKEIFLVQVPKSFDTTKAQFKSNTEVTCDGTTYFVNSNGSLADCDVVNADKNGKLIPGSVRLSGLLSLTKKVNLPKIDHEKVYEPKPLVPQKQNLRMRHFPTGYGPSSYGIKDASKASKASNADSKKPSDKQLKNKHSRDQDDEHEKPAKKHKKDHDEKKKSKKSKKNKD